MKIRVLGNRVLVRRDDLPEQTRGGVFLLGREYPTLGTVEAIGSGARNRSSLLRQTIDDVQVGDKIWFERKALDTREVAPGYFILDYNLCNAAARAIDGEMHMWPLGRKILVKRA